MAEIVVIILTFIVWLFPLVVAIGIAIEAKDILQESRPFILALLLITTGVCVYMIIEQVICRM